MTTAGSINASDNAKLVFERYGDRYFFAQVQMGGDSSLTAVRTKTAEINAIAKTNKKSVVVIVGG